MEVLPLSFHCSTWVCHLYICHQDYPHHSPSFQRFAVRTSKRIEEVSSKAAQKQQELAGRMKDLSKDFESFKNQ